MAESDMPARRDALSLLSSTYSDKFEKYLSALFSFPGEGMPLRLADAMSYSLMAGGKRLRPALCLASAERCGLAPEMAMPMACAIEFIHTASLIHDDLPCMDDDDLRRGRPTSHKVFGECLAVLAGDSLMIWAFGFALSGLNSNGVPAELASRAVACLSEASGPAGMCGGQVLDTDAQSRMASDDFVYRIAEAKTAALIRSSVVSGAILGGADERTLRHYGDYGTHLGLAFQIVDDILDVTGLAEELGKTPNKDASQDKMTFVSSYGLEGARRLAMEESSRAMDSLSPLFPDGDPLIDLAESLSERSR
ncbi:MAG: polyprenyl synthetase family protein [Synergistaceae bacterium]|jgi:geranylgeranyl diphosphate synthase type II|nr:polyprenyl synthetase family protein [Synergistaceae bacterium]